MIDNDPSNHSPSVFYLKTLLFAFIPFFCVLLPIFFMSLVALYLKIVRSDERPFMMIIRDRVITAVIVTLFFVHPSVWGTLLSFTMITLFFLIICEFCILFSQLTQQAFLLFSCKKISVESDGSYLFADLSQKCYTAEHLGWAIGISGHGTDFVNVTLSMWLTLSHIFIHLSGLGIPMVIFYVIGIPLLAFYVMRQNVDTLHSLETRRKFFFLYTVFIIYYIHCGKVSMILLKLPSFSGIWIEVVFLVCFI